MKKNSASFSIKQSLIWSAISGSLYGLAFVFPSGLFALFCFAPLIYVLAHTDRKFLFRTGITFGLINSAILLSWLPKSVWIYTDGHGLISIVFYLLAILILSAAYLVPVFFSYKIINNRSRISFLSVFFVASVWCLWELICGYLFRGIPWIQVGLYKGILYFNAPLQISVFGGGSIISFFLYLINIFLAFFFMKKNKAMLMGVISVIFLWSILSILAVNIYSAGNENEKAVRVAVVNENTPAHLKWNEQNGDILARNLLEMNKAAAALNPDMILWSESSVPWTFRMNDAFVREIIKEAAAHGNIYHLLGINSDSNDGKIYNSAYFFRDSFVFQRYDKRFLLTFAEKQPSLFSMPFMSGGFSAKEGNDHKVFNTELGDFGVLICNESLISSAAESLVNRGAGYLLVISNDGWVSNSQYLIQQHFLNTKLRAIEYRKEIIVNCNEGISGKIASDGEVEEQWQSDKGEVKILSIRENNISTFYAKNNFFVLYIYVLLILSSFLFHKKK